MTSSHSKVPAIFGHNIVENHLNDYFAGQPYGYYEQQYDDEAYLKTTFTSQLQGGCTTDACKAAYPSTEAGTEHALASLYPVDSVFPNGYERMSGLRVDRSSGMSTFQWAQEYSLTATAYRYVFQQRAEGSSTLSEFGCGHLVEQLYVMGDPEIIGPGQFLHCSVFFFFPLFPPFFRWLFVSYSRVWS